MDGYKIHKGIDKSPKFKGLSFRSIFILLVSFFLSFFGFIILTIWFSKTLSLSLAVLFLSGVYFLFSRIDKKYGEHGLTKRRVRAGIPQKIIIKPSRFVICQKEK